VICQSRFRLALANRLLLLHPHRGHARGRNQQALIVYLSVYCRYADRTSHYEFHPFGQLPFGGNGTVAGAPCDGTQKLPDAV
jgi:hypothetical protein